MNPFEILLTQTILDNKDQAQKRLENFADLYDLRNTMYNELQRVYRNVAPTLMSYDIECEFGKVNGDPQITFWFRGQSFAIESDGKNFLFGGEILSEKQLYQRVANWLVFGK